MAVASSRGRSELLQRKWNDRDSTACSPERTKVWTEPPHKLKLKPNTITTTTNNNDADVKTRVTVPVVYYLSRRGHLDHPHFMEVPLSSPRGLFLRDVIGRLNLLRGKGMASQYSWSSKRSYKNGYVWHDLEENDFIYPVHGGEYVLKGSEILETVSKSPETSSSCSVKNTPEFLPPAVRNRRRNQSWGGMSMDLHEYKVYKAESTREFDASTQTDEKRRRRIRGVIKEEIEGVGDATVEGEKVEQSTELTRDEISPPPSDSSPETLESLIKADGRLILASSSKSSSLQIQAVDQGDRSKRINIQTAGGGSCAAGKMKASSVLMSLISCGSLSFRDCGVAAVKEHGVSLTSHYRPRLPRGENQTAAGKDHGNDIMIMKDDGNGDVMEEIEKDARNKFAKMALEDKEYFSGSLLMDSNKDDFSSLKLKRSSSYNADRSSYWKVVARAEEGMRANCLPRRPKTQSTSSSHKNSQTKTSSSLGMGESTQDGN